MFLMIHHDIDCFCCNAMPLSPDQICPIPLSVNQQCPDTHDPREVHDAHIGPIAPGPLD